MAKTHNLATIKKLDGEKQLAFAEVYVPDMVDSQGDFMTADEIELMAYRFMMAGRVTKVDTEHDLEENGSFVVESFIARKGDPDFIEGSWVVGVHIPDSTVWAKVKSGEINGYSMYGHARHTQREIEIDIPDSGIVKGETLDAADHTHEFTVNFNDKGQMVGGTTNTVKKHSHKITKGTATDVASGHSHRFSFTEGLL